VAWWVLLSTTEQHPLTKERTTMSESSQQGDLEDVGTSDAAKRIGQAPTTTDLDDPERSSRNTAAGSGSQPGTGPVQPAADDDDIDPSDSIEPHNQGAV
jgi:hypothetical protein